MSTLMQASHQWSTRPDDERYLSLLDMQDHFAKLRSESRSVVAPSRKINVQPTDDNKGLMVTGPNGHAYTPTNWSFGQISRLANAPAGYLRTLASPLAADCINYGLMTRDIEDVGVLLHRGETDNTLRAATGPNYGRIWNADILRTLVNQFGDGVTGDWRVPGEFGKAVKVNKKNTTLYASDRDMFVFLADETNRIEVPNRRNGLMGTVARGFFAWNSEVGDKTFGIATFLFDYVCQNRIVWGAMEHKEVRIRHTVSAPEKFIEEMTPALETYAQSSSLSVTQAIEKARAARLDDKVDEFLANRFGKRMIPALHQIHLLEEERPIETLWDVTTAVTAYARTVPHQDQRVLLERQAGEIMEMAR